MTVGNSSNLGSMVATDDVDGAAQLAIAVLTSLEKAEESQTITESDKLEVCIITEEELTFFRFYFKHLKIEM